MFCILPSSIKFLSILQLDLSSFPKLMGDVMYVACKYNSSLPNSDSMDLDFYQRIINAYIVSFVLPEIFGVLVTWVFV